MDAVAFGQLVLQKSLIVGGPPAGGGFARTNLANLFIMTTLRPQPVLGPAFGTRLTSLNT